MSENKTKQGDRATLEACLNAPVFIPGKPSGKPGPAVAADSPRKGKPGATAAAAAGAVSAASSKAPGTPQQAAASAPQTAVNPSGGGSSKGGGSVAKGQPTSKLSAAAAAAPVFVPLAGKRPGGQAAAGPAAANGAPSSTAAPTAATPASGTPSQVKAWSKQPAPQSSRGASAQQQQQQQQQQKAANGKAAAAEPSSGSGKAAAAGGVSPAAATVTPAGGGAGSSSSSVKAGKPEPTNSGSSKAGTSGGGAAAASTNSTPAAGKQAAAAGAGATATAASSSSSSSNSAASAATGKMSASAMAFVPGKAAAAGSSGAAGGSSGNGGGAATAAAGSTAAAGGAAGSKQPAAAGPQSTPSKGWNSASALRSPGRAPRPPSNTTPSSGPSAAPAAGRGRGAAGRGSRLDFGGGRGAMGPLHRGPMLGAPGATPPSMGTPRRGAGSGPGTLASAQGQYMVPAGLYSAGPGRQLMSARFMSEALRQQLQQQNYMVQAKWSSTGQEETPLPERIGSYHTLYPLEELGVPEDSRPPSVLGVRSLVLKGISSQDGQAHALRVISGKQVLPAMELLGAARQAVEAWSLLSGHPGLSTPQEAFISPDLDGTPSLVVVYPYYPGDVTLAQAHLQPTKTLSGLVQASPPSEDTLWSYTLQLAAALRAVHAAGLAVRPACLAPSKVLVSPLGQLCISSLGVMEALSGEPAGGPPEDLLARQREDVGAMGQLLLTLACAGAGPVVPSVELAALHYSPDLLRLLGLLLGVDQGGVFSWRHLIALMGERALMEMDTLNMFNQNLMGDVRKEMENGRLLRLLVKLGFTNERPEGDPMSSWSETGDRYLLKLFRDFVFHQTAEDGTPLLDWGHVVECLNKLDAGTSEEVLLMSRDEQVLLLVTYADIKRCAEAAYEELKQAGHSPGLGGSSYRS